MWQLDSKYSIYFYRKWAFQTMTEKQVYSGLRNHGTTMSVPTMCYETRRWSYGLGSVSRNWPSIGLCLAVLDWLLYNSITSHKSCLLTLYTCTKEALLELDTLYHGGKGNPISAHCRQRNSELLFIWLVEPLQCVFCVEFVHAYCSYPSGSVWWMNFELWTCGRLSWKWAPKRNWPVPSLQRECTDSLIFMTCLMLLAYSNKLLYFFL